MSKLNVAVIGVGNIGRHHARNYFEMPQVNLVAICDLNIEEGRRLAKEYGCLFYDDYKKMLKEQKIDAASIAVPTFLHHRVACDVLDMKINVLLEKPIAVNLMEARDIINKAKENNLKLMIGHIERFNPAIRRLKDLIADNRLGNIISINIKRVGGLPPQIKDANVVIDLAVHDIDISNYLLGEYPKEVYGFKSKNLIDSQEDSAVILLKYPKASSFIEVNWITPVKFRTLDITGTKAFARLDYINQKITVYENGHFDKNNQYNDFNEFVSKYSSPDKIIVGINKMEPLKCELIEFVSSVLNNKEPLVTGEDAYKTLEIALKI
ncbi:MAG: Gfo/Idh/MocA family oxidoreductase [Candidatus Nealsonbacteria bacterium]|nr:Gfo/Idh/MocA family oxidoreductase [Candidatus Nealsonbacteria bacterium]